jgi:hypothetical protein
MFDIPTRKQFRKATGRSMWYSNIIKTNDQLINRMLKLLGDYKTVRMTGTHREEVVLRKIRRTSIAWIASNPEDKPRQSRTSVLDLTHRVNLRLGEIAETLHGAPTMQEELRRAVQRRQLKGAGLNVGKKYETEWKGMHWGKHQSTHGSLHTGMLRKHFEQARTRMPFDRWVQFVFLPQNEDDPGGVFFGGKYAPGQRLKAGAPDQFAKAMRTNMVRMLNARERRDFVIDFRGGSVIGPTGTLFDTGPFKSIHRGAKGKGWGIYVIAPDNTWYAGGHVINHFHHSSFLAGSRTLSAGELKVIQGQLKVISNKTGHYKAGPDELRYTLHLLRNKGVRLNDLLVDFFVAGSKKPTRHKALDWLAAGDKKVA